MPDDYQYQPFPLPQQQILGEQAYDPTQVGVDNPANVPGPGDPTSSPFGDQVASPIQSGGSTPTSTFDAVMYLASTGELVNVTIDGTINP